MKFESIIKHSLAERITLNILNLIKEKNLLPGQKLPPERELAAQLNVSRPSLREALRALSLLNIVEIRQGDGIYITSLELEELLEPLDFVLSLNDTIFLELFEARKIIEPGIASLAASKATESHLEKIEKDLDSLINFSNDLDRFVEADIRLHKDYGLASGNNLLQRFMDNLQTLGKQSRFRTTKITEDPERVINDHKRIIHALQTHDCEKAHEAMMAHLINTETRLARPMEKVG